LDGVLVFVFCSGFIFWKTKSLVFCLFKSLERRFLGEHTQRYKNTHKLKIEGQLALDQLSAFLVKHLEFR